MNAASAAKVKGNQQNKVSPGLRNIIRVFQARLPFLFNLSRFFPDALYNMRTNLK